MFPPMFKMKTMLGALTLCTALTLPALAQAKPVTIDLTLVGYGGKPAYLAMYLTDAQGNYAGSLWMAGGRARYYEHLSGWYNATGGDTRQIDGITGASVGSGSGLHVTVDVADALIDAGYSLHVDVAAERMMESPDDVVVPLTTAGSGQTVAGQGYVTQFAYKL